MLSRVRAAACGSHYSLDDGRRATVNVPRTAQVAWWGLAIRLCLPGSAQTQRRLASPSAQDLDEVDASENPARRPISALVTRSKSVD